MVIANPLCCCASSLFQDTEAVQVSSCCSSEKTSEDDSNTPCEGGCGCESVEKNKDREIYQPLVFQSQLSIIDEDEASHQPLVFSLNRSISNSLIITESPPPARILYGVFLL